MRVNSAAISSRVCTFSAFSDQRHNLKVLTFVAAPLRSVAVRVTVTLSAAGAVSAPVAVFTRTLSAVHVRETVFSSPSTEAVTLAGRVRKPV